MATPGPQASKIIDEPSEPAPAERQQQAEKNETTEFEFVDPLPPDWTCSLCLDVLKEPTLTSCGHHFCRQCIDRVIARDHVCPLCKDHGFQTLLDKATSRKINALQLYCKLKSRGCQWVGELGGLEAHLDVKKGDCEFVEVECDFSDFGCTSRMFRKALPEHREENVHKHLVLMAVMGSRTGGGESERRIQEQRAELIQQQLQKKDEEVRQQLQEKDKEVKEAQDELVKLKEEMLQKDDQMKGQVIQLKEETQDQLQLKDKEMKQGLARLENALQARNKEIQQQLQDRDKQIKEVQGQLQQEDQEMKQGLARLDEQLREKDRQVKEAQDELVKLKEEVLQKDEQLKHRVTELQQEMQTQLQQGLAKLENEIQAKNKEMQQQLQDRDKQIKEVQDQLQQKTKQIERVCDPETESLERRVREPCPPFEFTMTEFSKHKANNTEWRSPPFYSHRGGYKLCLAVYANGHDGHTGRYLNSFFFTMQGEYDGALTWPRRLDTTVELFNQSTGKWVVMPSIFNNSERKKPTSPCEMANRRYFIHHIGLAPYVKNDCLQFRIASVKLQ